MKIIVPQIVQDAINSMSGNKTIKSNTLKIYAALYSKQGLSDKHGYFPVASTYLEKVNKRYSKALKYFIEKGIIDYFKKIYIDENDIFKTRTTKSYNVDKGICARYKFKIDTSQGTEMDIDMGSPYKSRWYDIVKNSLSSMGYDSNITRDSYGRRVFHKAIQTYKLDFIGFCTIDAICSQPRLLFNYLKARNIVDIEYNKIFEEEKDFYQIVASRLNLKTREDAKKLFMFWINGNGYVPNVDIHKLFPVVSEYMKDIKMGNYKNGGSLLQRIESKIWIDNLLNNIPTEFAVPIHDCVIIKCQDAEKVLKYCQEKYPELRFKKKYI